MDAWWCMHVIVISPNRWYPIMNSSKHCKSSALRQCESAWFLYFSRPLIMETWNPGDFHRLSALGISPMALGLRKNNWRKYQCLAGLSGWIPESFHLRERIPRKWTSLDAWVQWTKGDVSIIMTPWGFLDNMHSVPAVCSALAANSSLFRHTFLGVRYVRFIWARTVNFQTKSRRTWRVLCSCDGHPARTKQGTLSCITNSNWFSTSVTYIM